jgi:hypothetical protein
VVGEVAAEARVGEDLGPAVGRMAADRCAHG